MSHRLRVGNKVHFLSRHTITHPTRDISPILILARDAPSIHTHTLTHTHTHTNTHKHTPDYWEEDGSTADEIHQEEDLLTQGVLTRSLTCAAHKHTHTQVCINMCSCRHS